MEDKYPVDRIEESTLQRLMVDEEEIKKCPWWKKISRFSKISLELCVLLEGKIRLLGSKVTN
jgi:hypothetical protein